jgi:hypothetical protein
MIREPSFELDGWRLLSAEDRNRAIPEFVIPSLEDRNSLQKGDMAQLLFEEVFDDPIDPTSVERMWVYVTEVHDQGYFGVLINIPALLPENNTLWEGTELPFRVDHIINWLASDGEPMPVEKRTSWPRD